MKISSVLLYSLCILLASLGIQRLYAQTEVVGQYPMLQGYHNASAIGLSDELSMTALHTRQLEGIESSSKSFIVVADMPLRLLERRHAVGVQLVGTSFGLFKDTSLGVRYAFRIGLGRLGMLQLGGGARLTTSVFDGAKVFIPAGIEGASSADDAIPQTEVSGRGIDAQFGIYYQYKNISLGIGVNNILGATILLGNKYKREQERSYNLVARYAWTIKGTAFELDPSLFFEMTEGQLYRLDLRLGAWYRERFYLAGIYRPGRAFGVNLGMRLGKVYAGYQFEQSTTELGRGSWGNHELLISYSMPVQMGDKKANKYKSVRLL